MVMVTKRLIEQKLHAKKLMKELNIKGFKADKLLRKDDLDQIYVSRCKLKTFFLSHLAINILKRVRLIWLWLCLTPLSTIFQLYRGNRFYWWRKPEYLEKTIDLP
jgi:hypothetical protein